jgi:mono/diheme cytochrome c family protein
MKNSIIAAVILSFGLMACGGGSEASSEKTTTKEKPQSMLKKKVDPMQDKGIGPISSVTLDAEINQEMAAKGKDTYDKMCTACHKPTEKFIGPAPKGVLDRRTPEWIMNMILNPEQMVKENDLAKKLLMEFNGSPMANQNLTEEEARNVLEYFRTL